MELHAFLMKVFQNMKFILANVGIDNLFDDYIAAMVSQAVSAANVLIDHMDEHRDTSPDASVVKLLAPYHDMCKEAVPPPIH